jgi:hypothetical protein
MSSVSGHPTTPPVSMVPTPPMHSVDSYGRPPTSNRPSPLPSTGMPQGGPLSSQGYSTNYRGPMGSVGISEYGSQPLPDAAYGSSSGPQLHNPASSFFGGGTNGNVTPGSSIQRSRPPSAEMRESSHDLSPTITPGNASTGSYNGLSGPHEPRGINLFHTRR